MEYNVVNIINKDINKDILKEIINIKLYNIINIMEYDRK